MQKVSETERLLGLMGEFYKQMEAARPRTSLGEPNYYDGVLWMATIAHGELRMICEKRLGIGRPTPKRKRKDAAPITARSGNKAGRSPAKDGNGTLPQGT